MRISRWGASNQKTKIQQLVRRLACEGSYYHSKRNTGMEVAFSTHNH